MSGKLILSHSWDFLLTPCKTEFVGRPLEQVYRAPLSEDPEFHVCAQSCPTVYDLLDCISSGSSVHGILWARILEWVAMLSCRRSSQHRDLTHVSCISCIKILYHWAIKEVHTWYLMLRSCSLKTLSNVIIELIFCKWILMQCWSMGWEFEDQTLTVFMAGDLYPTGPQSWPISAPLHFLCVLVFVVGTAVAISASCLQCQAVFGGWLNWSSWQLLVQYWVHWSMKVHGN